MTAVKKKNDNSFVLNWTYFINENEKKKKKKKEMETTFMYNLIYLSGIYKHLLQTLFFFYKMCCSSILC